MGYEFEDAQDDENKAKMTIGGLALALAGWGIKKYLDNQNDQKQFKQEQIITQIRQCEARINTINGKWFPSESEKAEAKRLSKEVQELKKML